MQDDTRQKDKHGHQAQPPQKKAIAKKRTAKQDTNYVDRFRWGFVDDSQPAETLPACPKQKDKNSNRRKIEAKTGAAPPNQKQRRKKTERVPLSTPALPSKDEDDDLTLPSYGRTALKNLLIGNVVVPQAGTKPPKKAVVPSTKTVVPSTKDVSPAAHHVNRPKKEQVVWDAEKCEYVPLVQRQEKKVSGDRPRHNSRENTNRSPRRSDNKKNIPQAAVSPHSKQHPPKERGERFDTADFEKDIEPTGFAKLGVSKEMLEALKIVQYTDPTPVQSGVFEKVKAGADVMGQAQTGTGKTAAFSIPIIEKVESCPPGNDPVALILVPTRELAVQVRDEAARLSHGRDIRITACYGGKPLGKQIERLRSGIDILIGTPGRILDLMQRGALSLKALRWVVLDEADRMLDIGFRPQIEKILRQTPADRQTLLFSATLAPQVVRLAHRYMKTPEVLDFSNKNIAVETIDQYYITVDQERKFDALLHLLQGQSPQQAIIFVRTKRGADRLSKMLLREYKSGGGITIAAIHGDLPQGERDAVMSRLRSGALRYLVATDVVGRGIDITGISHIINYDVPKFCDDYVHRVGRTGRMGKEGVAFTFVTVAEGSELTKIEMRIDSLLKRYELQGFESFTKPHDDTATLNDDLEEEPKPANRRRRYRNAL